jgi:hypothetical protein
MDWGVGKITFSPGWPEAQPVQGGKALRVMQEEALAKLLSERALVEKLKRSDADFPCGWDERDAKV